MNYKLLLNSAKTITNTDRMKWLEIRAWILIGLATAINGISLFYKLLCLQISALSYAWEKNNFQPTTRPQAIEPEANLIKCEIKGIVNERKKLNQRFNFFPCISQR